MMRKITIIFVMLMVFLVQGQVCAQDRYLDIVSFRALTTDTDARIQAPVEDQNGDKCALIKVSSNIRGLEFESPALGIVKQEVTRGEIWVYVPAGSKSVTVLHNDYPPYRHYQYPVKIESAMVYEMKVQGHREGDAVGPSNSQMLTLNIQPSTASLFIDNEEVPTDEGLFSAMMQKGSHTFRVEAPRYEPKSGDIDLGEQQVTRSIRLNEKFGFIEVTTYPEAGANVFINDELAGQTPFKSPALDPYKYNVRVEKEFFFPRDTTAIVNTGGETTPLVFTMVSTIKPKEPRKTFVMADAAMGTASHTSFGVMVGMVGKGGGYLHLRTDFRSVGADMKCDDSGLLSSGGVGTPYYKDGVSKKSRFSFTGGYVHRFTLNNPFKKGGMGGIYGFAGVGYGQRTLAWETTDGVLVENTDHSNSGVAAEIGGICRMGSLAVSLGYQTVNFKYHEFALGVGVFF